MPKVVDHYQRRSNFVAVSWGVIAEEGLNAATLRRVAAAAGVTTGSLTHYFSDREALLVESLRSAHYVAGARMLNAAAKTASDRDRLTAVLLEALPLDRCRLQEWRVWLAFWGEAVGNVKLSIENELRGAEWRELIETLITPLIADGRTLSQAAEKLLSLIDGLGVRMALTPAHGLEKARMTAGALVEEAVSALSRPPNPDPRLHETTKRKQR